MRLRAGTIFLFCGAVAITAWLVALMIVHRQPHYNGRALDEWFRSPSEEAFVAFEKAGTNSFPVLLEKLNGFSGSASVACMIIGRSFQKSQIQNTAIEAKLKDIMVHGEPGAQIDAYSAMRKLGLSIPISEVAAVAARSPSIQASEKELGREAKLPKLYSMTNSLDCAFIFELCNDSDPQIQMQTFSFLQTRDTSQKPELCNEEMGRALASLITNRTESMVLRSALSYVSMKPQRIVNNLDSVTTLLEKTSDRSIQLLCESLLAAVPSTRPLSEHTREVLGRLQSRPGVDVEVRRQAGYLLSTRSS